MDNALSRPNPASLPTPRKRQRLWLLIFAGLLLLLSGAAYRYFSFSRSVGSGPAGPPVERAAFQRAWTSRPAMLAGFGDSITAGFGARKGYGYFDRLVSNPQDEFSELRGVNLSSAFPRLTVTNFAVSGSTSHELLEGQLPRLAKADRETIGWVVITTGGNDLIHNYGKTAPTARGMYGASWLEAQPWIEAFAGRLEQIITGITDRFPGGSHIFLANIYDPTDGVGDIQRAGLPPWPDGLKILAEYNEVIGRCASEHPNVHIVGLHRGFLGHGIHCAEFWARHYDFHDPQYWYYTNLEDPNERGYDAIRRLFLNEMVKVASTLP